MGTKDGPIRIPELVWANRQVRSTDINSFFCWNEGMVTSVIAFAALVFCLFSEFLSST